MWFSIGSAASGFDNSFYMGSPQIGASSGHGPGNLFRSFPRPHSSPKMKLRLTYSPCLVIAWLIFLFLSYQAYLHVFVFAAQNSNAKWNSWLFCYSIESISQNQEVWPSISLNLHSHFVKAFKHTRSEKLKLKYFGILPNLISPI